MTTNQPTAPFPELAAAGDDGYDLSVWLTFTLNRYPAGVVAAESVEDRQLCIEAGRSDGRWQLRVSPWTGSLPDEDVLAEPPIVDLRDQTEGPDPLTLLRALLPACDLTPGRCVRKKIRASTRVDAARSGFRPLPARGFGTLGADAAVHKRAKTSFALGTRGRIGPWCAAHRRPARRPRAESASA